MTDVPIISIDEIEDNVDDSSVKLNINECHTDVEDLESDNDKKKINFISVLKPKSTSNGALTDVEDFEDSDENENEQEEPEYGPEISLNEMLDQGTIDEFSNLQGNVNKKKLQGMRSIQKTPSPTAFHLTVNPTDLGGTTDIEDLEGSGDECDDESVYSEDDKPIVLEGANVVDVHDSMNRKKNECKFAAKAVEGSSSSDSEGEKGLKNKPHKHFLKKAPRCEDQKSDVENIYFSDEEKRRKSQNPVPVLETPDIEVMAFDGSDNDDNENDQQFPEINITFVSSNEGKKKKKHKKTPAPSPMLKLPENPDEAVTDVENLNSSDDDEEEKVQRPKDLLPIAVVKSDALTDVEDFDDLDSNGEEDVKQPEIVLPSPTREFTVLVENKTGEPFKQTTPLPDNVLLGFEDFDADKGLTDIEDFSDESGNEDDDENDDTKYKDSFKFPDIDGGVVESSDHSVVKESSLRTTRTPEPKTDTEDIWFKKPEKGQDCRRRRTKSKHSNNKASKPNFLDTKYYVDEGAGSAHTDVEDLHVDEDDVLLKDKSINQRHATIECPSKEQSNADDKTDTEYYSAGDDTADDNTCTSDFVQSIKVHIDTFSTTMTRESTGNRQKDLSIPIIRRISATPRQTPRGSLCGTDVESIHCDSENDELVDYSRAQTATPIEIDRQLEELCSSEIYDKNKNGCDRAREQFEIKGYNANSEALTDVESLD